MALNYCVNCGEKLEEGAQTCAVCGEPVPILARKAEGETEAAHEAEVEAAHEAEVEAELAREAGAGVKAGVEAAAEGVQEAEAEAKAEAMAEAMHETEAEAMAEAMHEAEAEAAAGTEAIVTREAEVDSEPKANTDTEAQNEAESKTESMDKPKADDEDFSSFADFTGFDILASEAAAAGQPVAPADRTDVIAPISGMRNANEYLAPQEKKSYLGTVFKAVVGIAAVILIAAGIGLLTQPETQESIQKQLEAANSAQAASSAEDSSATGENEEGQDGAGAATETPASTSSGASSFAVSDAATALDDDTAFDYLTKTYDGLQSYNERVYSCIQTYNNVIVASDRSQREAAAGIANSLLTEIEKEMKMLDAMNIGKASSLYDDYENVRHLLDDQYQRLAVIVESYEISLKYDSPYQHQTEILEPLTRDLSYSGQNIYLEDFDAKYWSSRPTR